MCLKILYLHAKDKFYQQFLLDYLFLADKTAYLCAPKPKEL